MIQDTASQIKLGNTEFRKRIYKPLSTSETVQLEKLTNQEPYNDLSEKSPSGDLTGIMEETKSEDSLRSPRTQRR